MGKKMLAYENREVGVGVCTRGSLGTGFLQCQRAHCAGVLSSLDPGGFLSFSLAMGILLLADYQKQPMLSCIMHPWILL
ncbi:hypothetical protein I7I50_02249 [Histoplasma capsulatum G186AR]|uniref:Uncharacterized protein n=1 Tax=Ajellomyces capsulatus TaxID=5037 RepID=A0A8H7Z7F3_AJECA|nr:hypothetical protein I7I52_01087 [Histoplasma capsulatum]QSS71421.1 hypothetical protein I7I50_02249 [Histoplasma capsulatum G186AR]